MLNGFAPIASQDARILILGTMPSEASIRHGQYYGHPQNAFWRIIFGLWNEEPPLEYELRVKYLKEKRIALWDVLKGCERQGSADVSIRRPQPNDFGVLADICPNLEVVFFNSKNASEYYKRLVKPDVFKNLRKTILPSTSPARAMLFEKKLEMWIPVREAVEPS